MPPALPPATAELLHRGTVIPAHPLALHADRTLDERRQRALTRYYVAAGAGGVAVGVHTTQFAVRDHGLLRAVLELASQEVSRAVRDRPFLRIAGVCGPVRQAVQEAHTAREVGYDAVLVSPAGLPEADLGALLDRSAAIGEVLPVIGFYLQGAVGGRYLPRAYWRRLADQESTVAVKAAPFDRYRTLELVQGIAASDRGDDVALYTGNDDAIVADLLTPYHVAGPAGPVVRHFAGGLLGHWAVWTRSAVRLLDDVHAARAGDPAARRRALARLAGDTDANAAVYDVRGGFAGCIAGVHEVLCRQGLLAGTWCLDPAEGLSPGQAEEIARVHAAHPWLREEDAFVTDGLPHWLP
ncbi:dihydrodipicolinate synthase family protein [Streptomyces malaysiensis subsp. malaysiensis]|uniref:Dihydrodipicolinate synthase family protein n=1 Tax=Streptomyces malaysiensis TaxID=92644 RepID=A0ABX6WLD5_STRMQ|nr:MULTISPECIES: dihydrodipicolinate synthase family protein [Streptomyces]QPI61400.1 dihydrodipicolinate synthase family protein [Streptomyces solisilvae]UHH23182.1 dihydrodipicolinate synthase family protein [Streptomyces sp. HNM0561]